MEKLNEQLNAYFACSTRVYDKWINLKSSSLKCLKKIKNNSEQYQLIKRTNLSISEGEERNKLEKKLIANILLNIDSEMEELETYRKSMEEEVDCLERLHSKVDKITEGISIGNLPAGPMPYDLLLEQMHVIFRFFQGSYAKINAAYKLLNYENSDSVEVLRGAIADEDIPLDSIEKLMWYAKKFMENA